MEHPRDERVRDGVAAGSHHHLCFLQQTLACRWGRVGAADGGVEEPAVDDRVRGVLQVVGVREECVDLRSQCLRGVSPGILIPYIYGTHTCLTSNSAAIEGLNSTANQRGLLAMILLIRGKCFANRNEPEACSIATSSGEQNPATSRLSRLCAKQNAEMMSSEVDRNADSRSTGAPPLPAMTSLSWSRLNWRVLLAVRGWVGWVGCGIPSLAPAIAG